MQRAYLSRSGSRAARSPEEIVAGKVTQFAQDRLTITRAMAKRFKVSVAPDVERFFQAVATGHWEELNADFEALKQRRESGNGEDLGVLWGPILETLLIAECGHNWPAQKLLDYGDATLGALRPGMVYVGGTDPGRGIPTLLNETSDAERHIVITQNALADGSYLQYVNFLYGDRMATLTPEESQTALQDYMADAQQRLAHDQQFPDEPKQIRPGEDIRMVDNRVQVSGQVAVMDINERLLQALMAKNPEATFALEESFPLKSTYANATPLGPIMELRGEEAGNALSAERAAQSLDYWRATTQQLLADPEATGSKDTLMAYSKMATAQANLLADHKFTVEAEQAYRIASTIWPGMPEATTGLADVLIRAGRTDEARRLLDEFAQKYPDQRRAIETAGSWRFLIDAKTEPTPKP